MATQIEFELVSPKSLQLKDIKIGCCFQRFAEDAIWMRVAPTKTLVRSTMVHEVLTRGDCFVLNLATGVLTVMSYAVPAIELSTKIVVSRI